MRILHYSSSLQMYGIRNKEMDTTVGAFRIRGDRQLTHQPNKNDQS